MTWQLTTLPAASVGLALLEADAVLVGQWMFSRPLILGPIIGLACGKPWLGMLFGTIYELFSLDEKPMGSVVPINGAVAAGCAILLCAGPSAVPVEVSFPAGLGLGLGHKWIESAIRSWRASLTREAERRLSDEGRVPWARILFKGIGSHVAATAGFVYLGVAALGPLLAWAWRHAPPLARAPATIAFLAAPWIGLGVLLHALSRRRT